MMPLFVAMALGGGGGLQTSLAGTQGAHTRTRFADDCYAGVYLKNDGVEWAYSNAGVPEGTNLGDWLEVGTTSEMWVRCTLNAGTLDGANSGTGSWLAMTTSRGWAVVDTTIPGGPDTANFDLEMATDAGGVNIIETKNYIVSGEKGV